MDEALVEDSFTHNPVSVPYKFETIDESPGPTRKRRRRACTSVFGKGIDDKYHASNSVDIGHGCKISSLSRYTWEKKADTTLMLSFLPSVPYYWSFL